MFEYIAVQMVVFSCEQNEEGQDLCNLFKLTVCMCLFSGIVSAFLDNVTTLLLLSPVTVRLCKMILPDDAERLAIPLLIANAGKTFFSLCKFREGGRGRVTVTEEMNSVPKPWYMS